MTYIANISFFLKCENVAAVFIILAFAKRTRRVFMSTHILRSKKNIMSLMSLPGGTKLNLKPVYQVPDLLNLIFQSLEVVDRGSETQLQVTEN